MVALISFLLNLVASLFKSKSRLEAENAALRHQLIVLQRKVRALVPFTNSDRWFFVQLYRWFSSVLKGVTIIRPETIVRWHRAGWRCSPILREPAQVAPSGCGAPPESHALRLRDEKNCSKGRNNKADLGNHAFV